MLQRAEPGLPVSKRGWEKNSERHLFGWVLKALRDFQEIVVDEEYFSVIFPNRTTFILSQILLFRQPTWPPYHTWLQTKN